MSHRLCSAATRAWPCRVRPGREEDLRLEALVVHTRGAVAGGGDRVLDQHRDLVDRLRRDRPHRDVAPVLPDARDRADLGRRTARPAGARSRRGARPSGAGTGRTGRSRSSTFGHDDQRRRRGDPRRPPSRRRRSLSTRSFDGLVTRLRSRFGARIFRYICRGDEALLEAGAIGDAIGGVRRRRARPGEVGEPMHKRSMPRSWPPRRPSRSFSLPVPQPSPGATGRRTQQPPCRTSRPTRSAPRTGCTSSGPTPTARSRPPPSTRRSRSPRRRARRARARRARIRCGPSSARATSAAASATSPPIPTTQDVVYIATGSGGLWKSTDGGATFASAWDTTCRSRSARSPSTRTASSGSAPARSTTAAARPTTARASTSRPTAARRGRTWASRTATRSAGSPSTRATTTASSSPSRVRCTTRTRRAACS